MTIREMLTQINRMLDQNWVNDDSEVHIRLSQDKISELKAIAPMDATARVLGTSVDANKTHLFLVSE